MTAGQNVSMAAHDLPLNMTVPGTVMLRTNRFIATTSLLAASMMPVVYR
ncbi:MAG: hypothetical protein HOK58_00095 [Acidimicrobiaceae bacterium]|nr:hypothetical protein [Acidimicrobiaceae bacterium]